MVAADFNNDGAVDIALVRAVVPPATEVKLLLNRGDTTFESARDLPIGPDVTGVVAADLDRDGHVDLVATYSQGVVVLRNIGAAQFVAEPLIPLAFPPRSLTVIDFDRDGSEDVIGISERRVTLTLLRNVGHGTLVPARTVSFSDRVGVSIAVGDFDSDGAEDLVVGIGKLNSLLVFHNRAPRPSSLDCNNDGVPDECELVGNDCDANGIPDECELDADKNGVPDVCDQCANATADADHDGIPDCFDACPDDPHKSAPGVCGCGVADVDSDGDGVPDCIDNCPETPNPGQRDTDGDGVGDVCDGCPADRNKVAPGPCGCGMADIDTDRDSVMDCVDECPHDPYKTHPGVCGCGVPEMADCVVTFAVNSFTDGVDAAPGDGRCATSMGVCSLRAAIQEANARPGTHVISLPAGSYLLSLAGRREDAGGSGDLDILGDLQLRGAGAASTVVDGGALDRVFEVAPAAHVAISGITIQNGRYADTRFGPEAVGGIWNRGTLTLAHCAIRRNTAVLFGASAGAIANEGRLTLIDAQLTLNSGQTGGILNYGSLTVTASDLSRNTGFTAGAIDNSGVATVRTTRISGNGVMEATGAAVRNGAGTLTLQQSTVADSAFGAGIWIAAGSAMLVDSTVARHRHGAIVNRATLTVQRSLIADEGGLIHESGLANAGLATLTDTTIVGHRARTGAGIVNEGTLTLINTTVSGNMAYTASAILNAGILHLRSSTIAQNTALLYGGGVAVLNQTGTVDFANTLIAANSSEGPQASDCGGTLLSLGYNLVQNAAHCAISGAIGHLLTDVEPNLGPLQDNGGPVWTHALQSGSAAIDAGNPAVPGSGDTACPSRDERDVPRPHGAACDIGALEATINCGNGRLDAPEECDDGNTVSGDCCSSTCQRERPPLPGDADCNDAVTASDLPRLMQLLASGARATCRNDDANADCILTNLDVSATTTAVFASGPTEEPAPPLLRRCRRIS